MTQYVDYKEVHYKNTIANGLATEAEAFGAWLNQFFYESKEVEAELAKNAEALAFVNKAIETIGMDSFKECMSEMGNAKANLKSALETGKMNGCVKDAVLYEMDRKRR